jgi:3-hydroxymyristoyl/3-hydroxydecanoyl-(acyl carrier protein) dehydratase
MSTQCEQIYIAASHPALAGHFPGQPVVPGVVLLDRVAAALERLGAGHVSGFSQVKFVRPLLPEQRVELVIELDAGARFRISDGAQLIASGSVELSP